MAATPLCSLGVRGITVAAKNGYTPRPADSRSGTSRLCLVDVNQEEVSGWLDSAGARVRARNVDLLDRDRPSGSDLRSCAFSFDRYSIARSLGERAEMPTRQQSHAPAQMCAGRGVYPFSAATVIPRTPSEQGGVDGRRAPRERGRHRPPSADAEHEADTPKAATGAEENGYTPRPHRGALPVTQVNAPVPVNAQSTPSPAT
jgi:hypothetical protein